MTTEPTVQEGMVEEKKEGPRLAMRGALRGAEGPRTGSQHGLLTSLQAVSHMPGSIAGSMAPESLPLRPRHMQPHSFYSEETLEMLSTEMSFSALYMHELHQRRRGSHFMDSLAQDAHERALWASPDLPTPPPGDIALGAMPRRLSPQREEDEDEEEINNTDGFMEQAPLLRKPSPPPGV